MSEGNKVECDVELDVEDWRGRGPPRWAEFILTEEASVHRELGHLTSGDCHSSPKLERTSDTINR